MATTKILKSLPNQDALHRLAEVLRNRSPLALVGAGLSIPSGFPSWSQLVNDMDKRCGGTDDEYRMSLRSDSDLLWRAGEYRGMMGDDVFDKLIRTTFGRKARLKNDDPALGFVRLPFRHYITTNYDDVIPAALEKVKEAPPKRLNWCLDDDVRDFIFALRDTKSQQKSILHLHGHHSDPNSIILSDEKYTERYVRSFGTANKLFAIFSTEQVVFAGFSLSDPDLMALMREVNATMRPKESRHFAIMGLSDPQRELLERNRLRNRFGVEPVFYDTRRNDHSGLGEIVDRLLDLVANPPSSEAAFVAVDPEDVDSRRVEIRTREIDPEDPEKGQWGGLSVSNHRKITATVRTLEPDWFEVTIEVRSTDPKETPLKGEVIVHVHPTFFPKIRVVPVVRGIARLVLEGYGAYTVGVEADDGQTKLELDLSEIKKAPLMFRLN